MSLLPLVSCIVVGGGEALALRRSVKSVLDQGPRAQAVLLWGDESGAIPETVRELAGADSRVLVLSQARNRGPASAILGGIAAAAAPFVTFLYPGDEHVVGWYRHAVALLERDPRLVAVSGEWVLMQAPGEPVIRGSDPRRLAPPESRMRDLVVRKSAFLDPGIPPDVVAIPETDEVSKFLSLLGTAAVVRSGLPAIRHYPGPGPEKPESAASLNERGRALMASGALREALACFESALPLSLLDQDLATLHSNRATALHGLDRTDEALAGFDLALRIAPDLPLALCGRGQLLGDLGDMEQARESLERAVTLQPDFAIARLNLGMTCLAMGRWAEGWEHYEARWAGSHEAGLGRYARPVTTLRQWGGEAGIDNDAILVFMEQGLGDALQMARYFPLLALRFAKVSVVVRHQTLKRLFLASFSPMIEILDAHPENQGKWQWQCPALSLPRAFGTTVDTVPARLPYLVVHPDWSANWRARLNQTTGASLKVGLAWAGDRKHKSDPRRSIELRRFAPLLGQGGITWVSLQKQERASQVPAIPDDAVLHDWMDEASDLADTAGLISLLDLVISVDTSVAHLAGALGKPVWMLNRFEGEWRWLRGRDDSPWYPGMRIFTQRTPGDWDEVLKRVAAALAGVQLAFRPV